VSDDPKRSELCLEAQALRNDWPVRPEVRERILARIVEYVDPDAEQGATAPDRTVLRAAEVLALFCGLSLKQQALDLARQKLEGKKDAISLADLVSEAEGRAEARVRDRDPEGPAGRDGPAG
jgi:hypothetical protein